MSNMKSQRPRHVEHQSLRAVACRRRSGDHAWPGSSCRAGAPACGRRRARDRAPARLSRGHTAKSTTKCLPDLDAAGHRRVRDRVRARFRRRARRRSASPHAARRRRRTRASATAAVALRIIARAAGFQNANSASPLRHAMRSASAGGQVGEPRARPVGVLDDVVPALRREGVGADHEAVGKLGEQRAPVGGHLAAARRARCGTPGRTTGSCACAACRARCPAGRSPSAPTGSRASGSCRNRRSIASTSECACRTSLCCLASATMRRGTGRSASAP